MWRNDAFARRELHWLPALVINNRFQRRRFILEYLSKGEVVGLEPEHPLFEWVVILWAFGPRCHFPADFERQVGRSAIGCDHDVFVEQSRPPEWIERHHHFS